MKTAYIELNTTNQIKSLSKNNSTKPFIYLGIHIYPSTKVTSLSEILNLDFDYFVLDMGVLTNYTTKEFSNCQKQFLVCDFSPWKKNISLEKMTVLFQNSNLSRDDVMLLKNYKNETALTNLFTKNAKSFPYLSNPFHLSTVEFSDLNRLLL